MNYSDIKVGDWASLERSFEMEDLVEYSKLSLDENPVHLDVEYGKNSIFKDNIVHGMLVASLISGVLAEELPGYGTVYVAQDISFKKPVYLGDRCIARVEVLEKNDEKNIIKLSTKVYVDNEDNLVIDGQAVVKKP